MNTIEDLWDQLVNPADDLFDADGLRGPKSPADWPRVRRRNHQRTAAPRDPRSMPGPGRVQRVRHQRPRVPVDKTSKSLRN